MQAGVGRYQKGRAADDALRDRLSRQSISSSRTFVSGLMPLNSLAQLTRAENNVLLGTVVFGDRPSNDKMCLCALASHPAGPAQCMKSLRVQRFLSH
jgi:hypothetical protein